MVSFGPKLVVAVCTVLSGWMPRPTSAPVTLNGAGGGGGGGGGAWVTGGGGGGGGGSFLQPESRRSESPNRAAVRSIGVPLFETGALQSFGILRTCPGLMRSGLLPTTSLLAS